MKKSIGELLNLHFAGFGYNTVQWAELSPEAKSRWECQANQLMVRLAEDSRPVVEVFYEEFRGKGKPPADFKKASDDLQWKWKSRVKRFFQDIANALNSQQ